MASSVPASWSVTTIRAVPPPASPPLPPVDPLPPPPPVPCEATVTVAPGSTSVARVRVEVPPWPLAPRPPTPMLTIVPELKYSSTLPPAPPLPLESTASELVVSVPESMSTLADPPVPLPASPPAPTVPL